MMSPLTGVNKGLYRVTGRVEGVGLYEMTGNADSRTRMCIDVLRSMLFAHLASEYPLRIEGMYLEMNELAAEFVPSDVIVRGEE
jgi:hypothetical protein